eukprot:gene3651-2586_t
MLWCSSVEAFAAGGPQGIPHKENIGSIYIYIYIYIDLYIYALRDIRHPFPFFLLFIGGRIQLVNFVSLAAGGRLWDINSPDLPIGGAPPAPYRHVPFDQIRCKFPLFYLFQRSVRGVRLVLLFFVSRERLCPSFVVLFSLCVGLPVCWPPCLSPPFNSLTRIALFMPVSLTTPAHVRAHLRLMYNLIESVHKALTALVHSITSGISRWMEQQRVMVLVMERFGIDNFKYPRDLPEIAVAAVQPALLSDLRRQYFYPPELRDLLVKELCSPLVKLMNKQSSWTEEFEYCYSRNRTKRDRATDEFLSSVNSVVDPEPDLMKDRRKRILQQIQKLDVQLSTWIRHYTPKAFGIISLLYAFAAEQFDGKVVDGGIDQAAISSSVALILPHIALPSARGDRSLTSKPPEQPQRAKSVVDATSPNRCRSSGGGEAVNSLPEIIGSPSEVMDANEAELLSPSSTLHSPSSNGNGAAIPTPPVTLLPAVLQGGRSITGGAMSASSLGRSFDGSTPSLSRQRRVLSSREWGGESFTKEALIKQLEAQVDTGRVAFDNTISLSFAFSRSLEKLADAVLHDDEKYRGFLKVIRQSLFSLEEFVYRDYSELQSMLPLNFVKIIRQLDEQCDRRRSGFRRFFSNEKKPSLSPRTTAFPVRPVHLGVESTGSRAWLDRPVMEATIRGSSLTELAPNPMKRTQFDMETIEEQCEIILSSESSQRGSINSSPGDYTGVQLSPTERKRVKVCETVRAYNVLICGYFHRLSQVYQTESGKERHKTTREEEGARRDGAEPRRISFEEHTWRRSGIRMGIGVFIFVAVFVCLFVVGYSFCIQFVLFHMDRSHIFCISMILVVVRLDETFMTIMKFGSRQEEKKNDESSRQLTGCVFHWMILGYINDYSCITLQNTRQVELRDEDEGGSTATASVLCKEGRGEGREKFGRRPPPRLAPATPRRVTGTCYRYIYIYIVIFFVIRCPFHPSTPYTCSDAPCCLSLFFFLYIIIIIIKYYIYIWVHVRFIFIAYMPPSPRLSLCRASLSSMYLLVYSLFPIYTSSFHDMLLRFVRSLDAEALVLVLCVLTTQQQYDVSTSVSIYLELHPINRTITIIIIIIIRLFGTIVWVFVFCVSHIVLYFLIILLLFFSSTLFVTHFFVVGGVIFIFLRGFPLSHNFPFARSSTRAGGRVLAVYYTRFFIFGHRKAFHFYYILFALLVCYYESYIRRVVVVVVCVPRADLRGKTLASLIGLFFVVFFYRNDVAALVYQYFVVVFTSLCAARLFRPPPLVVEGNPLWTAETSSSYQTGVRENRRGRPTAELGRQTIEGAPNFSGLHFLTTRVSLDYYRENIRLCLESLYEAITNLHEVVSTLIKHLSELQTERRRLFDAIEFLAYRYQLSLCPYTRSTVMAPAVGNTREKQLSDALAVALQSEAKESERSKKFNAVMEKAICVPITKMIVALNTALHGSSAGSAVRKNSVRENRDPVLQLTAIRTLLADSLRQFTESFFAAMVCAASHALSSWARAPSSSALPTLISMEWCGRSARKKEAVSEAIARLRAWRAAFDDVVVHIMRALAKLEEVFPLVFQSGVVEPAHTQVLRVNKKMQLFFHAKFLNFHHDIVDIATQLKELVPSIFTSFSAPSHGQREVALPSVPSPTFSDMLSSSAQRITRQYQAELHSPTGSPHVALTPSMTMASDISSPSVQSTLPAERTGESSPFASHSPFSSPHRCSASQLESRITTPRSVSKQNSLDKPAMQVQKIIGELDSAAVSILQSLLKGLRTSSRASSGRYTGTYSSAQSGGLDYPVPGIIPVIHSEDEPPQINTKDHRVKLASAARDVILLISPCEWELLPSSFRTCTTTPRTPSESQPPSLPTGLVFCFVLFCFFTLDTIPMDAGGTEENLKRNKSFSCNAPKCRWWRFDVRINCSPSSTLPSCPHSFPCRAAVLLLVLFLSIVVLQSRSSKRQVPLRLLHGSVAAQTYVLVAVLARPQCHPVDPAEGNARLIRHVGGMREGAAVMKNEILRVSRSKEQMFAMVYNQSANGSSSQPVLPIPLSSDIPEEFKSFATRLYLFSTDRSMLETILNEELLGPVANLEQSVVLAKQKLESKKVPVDDDILIGSLDIPTTFHNLVKRFTRFMFCLSCYNRDSWMHQKNLRAAQPDASLVTADRSSTDNSCTTISSGVVPILNPSHQSSSGTVQVLLSDRHAKRDKAIASPVSTPAYRQLCAMSTLPPSSAGIRVDSKEPRTPGASHSSLRFQDATQVALLHQSILECKGYFDSFFRSVENCVRRMLDFNEFLASKKCGLSGNNEVDLRNLQHIARGLERCSTAALETEVGFLPVDGSGEGEKNMSKFEAFSMISSLTAMLEQRCLNEKDSLTGLPQSPRLSYCSVPMMEILPEEESEEGQSSRHVTAGAASTLFNTADMPVMSPDLSGETVFFPPGTATLSSSQQHGTDAAQRSRPSHSQRFPRLRRLSGNSVMDASGQVSICFLPMDESTRGVSPSAPRCSVEIVGGSETTSTVRVVSPPHSGQGGRVRAFQRSVSGTLSDAAPGAVATGEAFFQIIVGRLEEMAMQLAEELKTCFLSGLKETKDKQGLGGPLGSTGVAPLDRVLLHIYLAYYSKPVKTLRASDPVRSNFEPSTRSLINVVREEKKNKKQKSNPIIPIVFYCSFIYRSISSAGHTLVYSFIDLISISVTIISHPGTSQIRIIYCIILYVVALHFKRLQTDVAAAPKEKVFTAAIHISGDIWVLVPVYRNKEGSPQNLHRIIPGVFCLSSSYAYYFYFTLLNYNSCYIKKLDTISGAMGGRHGSTDVGSRRTPETLFTTPQRTLDAVSHGSSGRQKRRTSPDDFVAYLKLCLHHVRCLHEDVHELVNEVLEHIKIARRLYDEIFYFLSRYGIPVRNYPREPYRMDSMRIHLFPLYVEAMSTVTLHSADFATLVENVLLYPLALLEVRLTSIMEDLQLIADGSGQPLPAAMNPSDIREVNAFTTDVLSFVTDHFYKIMAALFDHLHHCFTFNISDYWEDPLNPLPLRRFVSIENQDHKYSKKAAAQRLLELAECTKASYDSLIAISCRCARNIEKTFKIIKYVGDQRSYLISITMAVSSSLRRFTSVGYRRFFDDVQVDLIEPLQKLAGGWLFPFAPSKKKKPAPKLQADAKSNIELSMPKLGGTGTPPRHRSCQCFGKERLPGHRLDASDKHADNPLALSNRSDGDDASVVFMLLRAQSTSSPSMCSPSSQSFKTGSSFARNEEDGAKPAWSPPKGFVDFTKIVECYREYVEAQRSSSRSCIPSYRSRYSSTSTATPSAHSSVKRLSGGRASSVSRRCPPLELAVPSAAGPSPSLFQPASEDHIDRGAPPEAEEEFEENGKGRKSWRLASSLSPHRGTTRTFTRKQKEVLDIIVRLKKLSSRFVREVANCFTCPGCYEAFFTSQESVILWHQEARHTSLREQDRQMWIRLCLRRAHGGLETTSVLPFHSKSACYCCCVWHKHFCLVHSARIRYRFGLNDPFLCSAKDRGGGIIINAVMMMASALVHLNYTEQNVVVVVSVLFSEEFFDTVLG